MQDTTRCDGMYPRSSTLETEVIRAWVYDILRFIEKTISYIFFKKNFESGVIHDYSFSTWEMRLEDQELKFKLSYIAHLRLAWTICGLTKK